MSTETESTSDALESVVTRFADMVRSVGHHHGLSDDDVDEVMQEVRIRLWRSRSTAENISSLPASYVYRTAASAALDVIRRRRARREDHVDMAALNGEGLAGTAPAPDRALGQSELREALAQAIAGLSDSRRPVVRMYLVGYSRQEIADLLGWSEAKTRNLLYRGLDDLRRGLSLRGIGPETAG